jgi:mono/diheme cytochrome c family protein
MRLGAALVAVAAALLLAGCGGAEETQPLPEGVTGTTTQAGETTETETAGDEGAGGDAEAGRSIYDSAGCGSCHALEAAGSTGTIGPNLDQSQPDLALIVDRVTNGSGVMPAFEDQLSDQEIQDVAAFVFESTRG